MSNPSPSNETLLSTTRLALAGGRELAWGTRTYVMGIINVTPDSFSGDGLAYDIPAIIDRAKAMEADGADMLDLGAESTRPGSEPVPAEEELRRLLPALEAVAANVGIPISVDTYKAQVARQAVEYGASIINDVWGLKADPEMAQAAAETGAALILMHNQDDRSYGDLMAEVSASLAGSAAAAEEAGVPSDQIILDPGIGFGKTADHNLEILGRLSDLKAMGYPLLVGASRKSTIGLVLDLPADQRLEGTAAAVALAIERGADIVRVHDVKEMVRVSRMSDAIVRGWRPEGWTA